MALRAAHNAGLFVPGETSTGPTDYVKRCQNADGGFMYMLSAGGESGFPRSAAAVVALNSAGIYDGPEITKGLDYLDAVPARRGRGPPRQTATTNTAITTPCRRCGRPAATAGPAGIRPSATTDRPAAGRRLLDLRLRAGIRHGHVAMVLQMPENQLPIFQR